MKVWRQSQFACVHCGTLLAHNDMHNHVQHLCEERPAALRQRLLETGRRYEPITERDR